MINNLIMKQYFLFAALLLITVIAFSGCKNYTAEEKQYIDNIEKQRLEKNEEYKTSPASPFNQEPKVHFEPLKYYDVDPEYVFKSKLTEYTPKDTITIYGTKGEARSVVKYGYLQFTTHGKTFRMNVYEGVSKSGQKYHSLWFTDRTTNNETYGVGRYLDFELEPDPEFVYTIDFNLAYNPYCAYSPRYSCAIPSKEDYLDFAVEAGEKKFHE